MATSDGLLRQAKKLRDSLVEPEPIRYITRWGNDPGPVDDENCIHIITRWTSNALGDESDE